MIQSELHGDVQSQAEMPWPSGPNGLGVTKLTPVVLALNVGH